MKKMIGLLALVTLVAMSPVAFAQPVHLQPASVLVFPLYDSAPGAGTVICVTNLNDSEIYCPDSDYREGDIMVHYQYIDGTTWQEFDRFEFLTPGDTTCVIADQHNPEENAGFVVVSAVDPQDMNRRVDFDHLVGSCIVVQSGLNFLWTYTPYAFRATADSSDACDLDGTDDDGDGAIDFDGDEYDVFPAELFIDSFFEETGNFENQLTLMTTAGADYLAEANFLFWNNIEEKFSRTYRFTCWSQGPLSDVSAIVTNLGGDPDELGQGTIQTGWASIRGGRMLDGSGNPVLNENDALASAPLLGVFAQFITSEDFAAGKALHYRGTIDGLEFLTGDGDPQTAP